jgi:predicted PurR-regulated permease PerM
VGGLLAELGHGFFVLVITTFFVIEFTVLFPALAANADAPRSFATRFGELTQDIQKYMGINTIVNVMSQVGLLAILLVMHVPFVATWIVLAFVCGYIPTIGGAIAMVPVLLITLLEQGPTRALIILLIYIPMSFVLGDIIKPRIMQQGFEISIITVFFALVFWNFVLGPIGVLLAVPLTITGRKLYREFGPDVQSLVAP